MDCLIKNACIITLDNDIVYKNGCLVYSDNKITYVGEETPKGDFKKVVDAGENIVMPSFSNAHGHSAMTLFRGYSEGYRLQDWLEKKIFPVEAKLKREDVYWGTMLAISEMISTGTTLVNDSYFFSDRACDAYLKAGMNANVSRSVCSFSDGPFCDDYRIKEAVELYKNYNNKGDGAIIIEMSPHAVYTCSYNYLKYVAEIADKYNMPVNSHMSENDEEVTGCMDKYAKTPTEIYKDAGLLNRPALFAHCVRLNDRDYDMLKGHSVAHNPKSNLKLGSGIADVIKMMDRGINVCIGTDGASSNNTLDMIDEMKTAALLMCNKHKDPSLVKPMEVIKMATLNGAIAMKRETKGMLKAGYDADFIMINRDVPNMYPNHIPENSLLYGAKGNDVVLTVCGGKTLYEKGEYKTIDIEKIKKEVLLAKKRLFD